MTERQVRVQLPEKLGFLLAEKSRYKVAYGGRGSGKSWGAAQALLVLAASRRLRILCTREVQKSIKDSVHRLLSDQIDALGLAEQFTVLRDEIRGRNGSQFLFAGLSDNTADTLKSFEGVDICWVEEAQTVSERSWSILIPTIRKDGSEIWITFNPDLETDPTYSRFVMQPPPGSLVHKVDWQDNPWFPRVLRDEKDHLYRVDPDAAAWIWGGQCRRNSDAQVLRGKYSVEGFTPDASLWGGPYYGVDWGFATDPTVMVRCWVWEGRLYVEQEAYGLGVEIEQTPALFDAVDGSRACVSRADSARPEMVSYCVRNGFPRMTSAKKWPGCVEDGVSFLRAFDRIIIHPSCVHTAEEAGLWSFKKDRLSGDILPVLVDKHNHCWDALRYALEPHILKHKERVEPEEDPRPISYHQSRSTGWMAM